MFIVGYCKNGCKYHNGCFGCGKSQCKFESEYDENEYCDDCYNKIKPEIEKIEELKTIIEEKLKTNNNI